jgi:hypothetical protein
LLRGRRRGYRAEERDQNDDAAAEGPEVGTHARSTIREAPRPRNPSLLLRADQVIE